MKQMHLRLPRRSFLQGLGAGALLCSPIMKNFYAQAQGNSKTRFLFFFTPEGVQIDEFLPTGSGSNFKLTEQLSPLESLKQYIAVLNGISMVNPSSPNAHEWGYPQLLTGIPAPESLKSGGASFDYILEKMFANESKIGALRLAAGGHWPLYFSDKSAEIRPEQSPARAFGSSLATQITPAGVDAKDQIDRLALRRKSVLDSVSEDITTVRTRLGGNERAHLDFHLEQLSQLGKDLGISGQKVEAGGVCSLPSDTVSKTESSTNSNADFRGVVESHIQIIRTAFACNLTRIACFGLGGMPDDINWTDSTGKQQTKLITRSHHGLSHWEPKNPDEKLQFKAANKYYMSILARIMNVLKDTRDGEKTLLDNTVIVWCSECHSDHNQDLKPVIFAGGGGGRLKTGQLVELETITKRKDHIISSRYENDLWLTVAQILGVNMANIGDSKFCKGPISQLLT